MNKKENENIKVPNSKKKDERVEDMHLLLSEKYMTYKDLADRCLINNKQIDKGDKRVFYLKPSTIFLDEPRLQNQYRHEFVKIVETPPQPEPPTLIADDMYRDLIEQTQDKSNPELLKIELANFFKRRQYKLQHKKYKLLLRWSHYALTSELVDKVSLKFSPCYSKVQFELENSVKRYQRLEGEDHFLNPLKKHDLGKNTGLVFEENQREVQSTLRADDIDVYLRIVTYEEKINRESEKFLQRVKWISLSQRFEIFQSSIIYFQKLRNQSLERQRERVKTLELKGKQLISLKKHFIDDGTLSGRVGKDLIKQAEKELDNIIESLNITKLDRITIDNVREKYINSCKYNYEYPDLIITNEVELKVQIIAICQYFNVGGDLEIDNGHSFAYSIMVFFPTYFQSQVIKSQFAPYDAVPSLIDPTTLAKNNVKKVIDRNKRRYGKTTKQNGMLEILEIKQKEEEMQTEYINQID